MKPDLDYYIETMREERINLNGGSKDMEWYSPNREFKFVINRYENNLWNNDTDGHFVITVDIFNNIGILITQLKFSEIDAIRILDAINNFQYEMECQTGSSMYIYINANNLRLDNKIIFLERLNVCPPDDYEMIDKYYFRDISFKINQYSPFHQTIITIINIVLSQEELENLAFKLFFYTLIDIELPEKYNIELENLVQDLYIEKFNLFGDNI